MGTAVLWLHVKKLWIAEVHPVQHGQADAARLAEGRVPGAPGPVLPRPATQRPCFETFEGGGHRLRLIDLEGGGGSVSDTCRTEKISHESFQTVCHTLFAPKTASETLFASPSINTGYGTKKGLRDQVLLRLGRRERLRPRGGGPPLQVGSAGWLATCYTRLSSQISANFRQVSCRSVWTPVIQAGV